MGNKFATDFYRVCAEHTFAELKKVDDNNNVDVFIFSSEENEIDKIKNWIGNDFTYYWQSGTNLGERMFNAFQKVFDDSYDNVVIIGSDAPEINSDLIIKSFNKLNNYEAVIGPSDDGGYYLLGLKKAEIKLFENIKWSTDSVFNSTIAIFEKQNLKYYLMKELTDIDTKSDLYNWMNSIDKKENNVFKQLVKQKIVSNDFLP